MQCPRCYYTNTAGTNVCEYCGAQLAGAQPAPGGGSASSKRKTVLGPPPSADAPAPPPVPTRTSRIDPLDPFRIAAEGIADPPPASAPSPPPVVERSDPVEADRPAPPPRRPARSTVLTGPSVGDLAPLAGVALVIEADGTATPVVLREGRVRIGRRSDLEIVVSDPTASSEHALLRLQGEDAWLLDTSSNGTIVAGERCLNDRAPVRDGSVLGIGGSRIVIKLLSLETLAKLDGCDP